MFLLQWFSRKPRRERGSQAHAAVDSARGDSDLHGKSAPTRRSQRSQRREQLYGVVRDAMVRVGILSAGYKFKVLALDAAGHRFVIMVDLAPAYVAQATRLKEIEDLIAELAKARLQVVVPAVYWRVGDTGKTQPAEPGSSRSAALQQREPQAAAAKAPSRAGSADAPPFEPIDAQEMDAFKQAVAAAAAQGRRAPGPDFAASELDLLGGTQYGELR
ncbi:hypothetical protein GCM10010975_32540 [Comamonas phosphati]|nr:hypothetical protein GCM10010975_32540 [Comamonas phosphati]